jgi:hypothetical protein
MAVAGMVAAGIEAAWAVVVEAFEPGIAEAEGLGPALAVASRVVQVLL